MVALAVCLVAAGCVAVSSVLALLYTGEEPIRVKVLRRLRASHEDKETDLNETPAILDPPAGGSSHKR
jgi:hypothetical protein